MISVTANITFKDFLNYNFYKHYKNPFQILLQLVVVFIMITWLIAWVIDYPIDERFTMVAAVCAFQFCIVVPLRIYFSSKKEYKSKKEFHSPIEFTFNTDGIKAESVLSKNFSNWETIEKITETNRWFILYFNKHLAALVPLNSFTNTEQLQQFRTIINSLPQIKTNFK